MKQGKIYTIGHSTLSSSDFLKTVDKVDVIVDARSHPTSKWEQFRKESLELWIPEAGKSYEWNRRLGGWTKVDMKYADRFARVDVDVSAYANGKFPKHHIAAATSESDRPTWTNRGLYDYSWFTSLKSFMKAADELIVRARSGVNIGFMCAELLWWKCHRSMIADYLVFRGANPIHLQPKLTQHKDAIGNRLERYHPSVIAKWKKWIREHPLS